MTAQTPDGDSARDRQRAAVRAPVDPRLSWPDSDLQVEAGTTRLSDSVVRVLAPNPSPMTLDGTNTYVVGDTGGDVVVIDPGPTDAIHLEAIERAVRDQDATVVAVVATHHHLDHAESAGIVSGGFKVPLWCADPALLPEASAGERLGVGAARFSSTLSMSILATPGHTADSITVRPSSGELITGDQVLGRGTSMIGYPEGNVQQHMDSVRLLLRLGSGEIYPGHGPHLAHGADDVLEFYLEHRRYRRRQVLAALDNGPAQTSDLVDVVYPGIEPLLLPAATRTLMAMLDHLRQQEEVVFDTTVDTWRRTTWNS